MTENFSFVWMKKNILEESAQLNIIIQDLMEGLDESNPKLLGGLIQIYQFFDNIKQVLSKLLQEQVIKFDYQNMNIHESNIVENDNSNEQNDSSIDENQSMLSKSSQNEVQYDSQDSIDKKQLDGYMEDELENEMSDNNSNDNKSQQTQDSQFLDVQNKMVSCKKCFKILFESQCQQHCQSKGCTIQFHCPKCNKEQYNIPNLIFHDYLKHQINYDEKKNICCEFCYKDFKRSYYKQHLVRLHMDKLKQMKERYYTYINKLQQICDRIISEYNIRQIQDQDKDNDKKKKKHKYINKQQQKQINNKTQEIEYAFVVEKLDYESLFTQQFDTSWQCNECGQRKVKNDRYEHWLNFHSSEIVLCRNCPKQFIFVSEMVLHDYFRHGDAFNLNAKFDTCEYCNKEIRKDRKKDFSIYKNHLFKYHKKQIHELIERYKLDQKIDIIKVAQIKENNNIDKIDNENEDKQISYWKKDENIQRLEFQQNLLQTPDHKFQCKSCYKILSTKISYYNHWFYNHIKYPYTCEYCSRPNCFISDYLTHIFTYHTDTKRDELVQNKIQCNQCGRLMDNKQSYIMHIKKYHEQFIEELFKQNLHKFPQYEKSSQI